MKVFSQVVSWVFLPLLMPMYALLIVLYVPSNQDYLFNDDCMYSMPSYNKLVVVLYYSIFGVVMPAISYGIMRMSGMISTIEMDDKRERSMPIILMMAYCVVLYIFLIKLFSESHAPKYVYSLALSGIAVSVVHLLLNMWKKVSIHAGGTGIAFGFILAYILNHAEYEFWIIVVPVIASGIVMTARLYLKKHDMTEVVIGWFLGSFITFAINYLY